MNLQKYDKEYLIKEIEKLRLALYQNKHYLKNSKKFEESSFPDEGIDMVMEFNQDGKILKTNKFWRQTLGYLEEDINRKYVRDIVYVDDLQIMISAVSKLISTSQQQFIDLRLSSKNNDRIFCTGIIFLHKKRKTILSYFQDVTDRVHAQKAKKLYTEITNLTLNSNDLSNLYRNIHAKLQETMNARNFFIAQLNFEKQLLFFPYIFDEEIPNSPQSITYDYRKGICEYIYHLKKPTLLKEADIMNLILQGKIIQYGTIPKALIGVPFQTERGIPGVIGVQSYRDENTYQNSDLELLNFISNQVLLSVERKFNEEKISSQAARLQSIFNSSNHIIWSINKNFEITSFNQNFEYEFLKYFKFKPIVNVNLMAENVLNLFNQEDVIFWKEKFEQTLKGAAQSFEISFMSYEEDKTI